MTNQSDPKPSTLSVSEKTVSQARKKRYATPTLRVYGTVSTLTAGSNGSLPDTNTGAMMGLSDPRAKEAIVRVGTHPLGFGLYLFDYKPEYRDAWGHGRQFGPMADEVGTIIPEAVSVHPDGYKMVNYAKLRISRALH